MNNHFVYTLSTKGTVIYIGLTWSPYYRYKQHYTQWTSPCSYLRHLIVNTGECATMDIVYHSTDYKSALKVEGWLINQARLSGKVLFNTHCINPEKTFYPPVKLASIQAYKIYNPQIKSIQTDVAAIVAGEKIPFYNLADFNLFLSKKTLQ